MNPILTIINDGDKEFDEFTTAIPWELDEKSHYVDASPEELKSFTHSRELALLEGLKEEVEKHHQSNTYEDNEAAVFHTTIKEILSIFDEAITHLKK